MRFLYRLANHPPRAPTRPTRLTLEPLEDRTVPSAFTLGPLVQVSGPSPFADSTADAFLGPLRAVNKESEGRIAVNPTDPNNLVGVWRQDQGAGPDIPSRGVVAGASFDGGLTWHSAVVPGVSLVSGGTYNAAANPWVSIGPTGVVYVVSLSVDHDAPFEATGIAVNRSTDGGLSWGDPVYVRRDAAGTLLSDDKPVITADPTDPNLVYTAWTQYTIFPDFSGYAAPVVFARSTDGGRTWGPTRTISEPLRKTTGAQINVRPDGSLIATFDVSPDLSLLSPGLLQLDLGAAVSKDHGLTWATLTEHAGTISALRVTDPETGREVIANGTLPDVTVDRHNGNLYAVWSDARFSGFRHEAVAFAMSADGGATWSSPVQINKTPTTVPDANQQAFSPTIAVADDGTVAVAYYDLRNNTPAAGLPTDFWVVHAEPGADLTDPAAWGHEQRLTESSFDVEKAVSVSRGPSTGDYQGLTASGNAFLAFFTVTTNTDPGNVSFRRLVVPHVTTSVHGHTLRIDGDRADNRIDVRIDGRGGVSVSEEGGPARQFTRIDRIEVTAKGGDDAVNIRLGGPDTIDNPDVRLPDLLVDLGAGDDRFALVAAIAPQYRPAGGWRIDLETGGGNNTLRTDIAGSVPVRMTADLGGHDISIFEFHDVKAMPAPTDVTVNSSGTSDITVIYGFNPQPEPPGVVGHLQAPIRTTVNGASSDRISVAHLFECASGGASDPPLGFGIPLETNITGGRDVRVRYAAIGPDHRPADAPFFLNAPITTNVLAGNGAGNILFEFFVPPPTADGAGTPPILNSTLRFRLEGGDHNDTIRADVVVSPMSTGRVDGLVRGGKGKDDLTLNIFGYPDHNNFSALIDGGDGIDTAHHTDGVRVRNVER